MTTWVDFASAQRILQRHEEAGLIQSWSIGYTGHAQARAFVDVTLPNGQTHRFAKDEIHAFLIGMNAREV